MLAIVSLKTILPMIVVSFSLFVYYFIFSSVLLRLQVACRLSMKQYLELLPRLFHSVLYFTSWFFFIVITWWS